MKVIALRLVVDDDVEAEQMAEILVEARHVHQRHIYAAQELYLIGNPSVSKMYEKLGPLFQRPNLNWDGGHALPSGPPPKPHEPRNAGVDERSGS